MKPRVKRIPPQDMENLRAVERLESEIFSDPWSLRSICDAACNPCTTLYGAFTEEDRLVGYLFFTQVMDTAEISNVAAAPDCRRQGIASLLLHTALEGVEAEIFLEVRKSNLPAIALYQKYGFAEYGIRKNYYSSPREDAVLMKRPMT